jgi:hypothetical protein
MILWKSANLAQKLPSKYLYPNKWKTYVERATDFKFHLGYP